MLSTCLLSGVLGLSGSLPIQEWSRDGVPWRAVALDTGLESAVYLLGLDGVLDRAPVEEPVAVEGLSIDVRALSSEGLVVALGLEDRRASDHAESLLRTQGEAAAEALLEGLAGAVPAVQERRLRLLSRAPIAAQQRPVRQLLRASSDGVRRWALAAYAATEPSDLVDVCSFALSDRSELVRHEAAGRLGSCGRPEAVEPLVSALGDERHRAVRLALFQGLRRSTQQRFGRDAEAWGTWWTNHGEEFLAEATERQRAAPGSKRPTVGPDRGVAAKRRPALRIPPGVELGGERPPARRGGLPRN